MMLRTLWDDSQKARWKRRRATAYLLKQRAILSENGNGVRTRSTNEQPLPISSIHSLQGRNVKTIGSVELYRKKPEIAPDLCLTISRSTHQYIVVTVSKAGLAKELKKAAD